MPLNAHILSKCKPSLASTGSHKQMGAPTHDTHTHTHTAHRGARIQNRRGIERRSGRPIKMKYLTCWRKQNTWEGGRKPAHLATSITCTEFTVDSPANKSLVELLACLDLSVWALSKNPWLYQVEGALARLLSHSMWPLPKTLGSVRSRRNAWVLSFVRTYPEIIHQQIHWFSCVLVEPLDGASAKNPWL